MRRSSPTTGGGRRCWSTARSPRPRGPGVTGWHLSLSHDAGIASAVVIAEGDRRAGLGWVKDRQTHRLGLWPSRRGADERSCRTQTRAAKAGNMKRGRWPLSRTAGHAARGGAKRDGRRVRAGSLYELGHGRWGGGVAASAEQTAGRGWRPGERRAAGGAPPSPRSRGGGGGYPGGSRGAAGRRAAAVTCRRRRARGVRAHRAADRAATSSGGLLRTRSGTRTDDVARLRGSGGRGGRPARRRSRRSRSSRPTPPGPPSPSTYRAGWTPPTARLPGAR